MLGQPAGHRAMHHQNALATEPGLDLGGAGPGLMQLQQLGGVTIQPGGSAAEGCFAGNGGLLAKAGQLGDGIETHAGLHARG